MLGSLFPNASITLHLGAHRTGTTKLQQQLDQVLDMRVDPRLAILTPPRAGKRDVGSIRSLFAEYSRLRKRWPAFLLRRKMGRRLHVLAPPGNPSRARRVIASDEMCLGTAFSENKASIYPDHEYVLHTLREFIGQNVSDIHITVRDYADFIASAYAMRAVYARNIGEFDIYKDSFLALRIRWPEIITCIHSAFPQAELNIWQFPCNLADDAQIRHILDGMDPPSQQDPENLNASPGNSAIHYALRHKLDQDYDPDKMMRTLMSDDRFDPFSVEERSMLDDRYSRDLVRLAEMSETCGFALHGFG